ncbi:MAG: hypothetical protein LBV71_19080, partial [Prevotella sp.]|nr:hypothetical protein [Prevotella sp.]
FALRLKLTDWVPRLRNRGQECRATTRQRLSRYSCRASARRRLLHVRVPSERNGMKLKHV